MPAAFGLLNQGILNVSKVQTGEVTLSRLVYRKGEYRIHMVHGNAVKPPRWEEYGWAQPAPQLPSVKVEMANVEDFAQNVACQHYIVTYGDNRAKIRALAAILGIEVYES